MLGRPKLLALATKYEEVTDSMLLAGFTLVTRILCHGPIYFADGPYHVEVIADKSYVIQPPGYWLFNRIAGVFADPVLAISVMNVLLSVVGVIAFYLTARFFASRKNAFIASVTFSCVFFLWFSGEIHSSYASQILFPVATLYALLRYERDRRDWALWLAAVLFSTGAGMRPSDGIFLIPVLLYYSWYRLTRGKALIFLIIICVLCAAWLIPTVVAYRDHPPPVESFKYVAKVVKSTSILTGVTRRSLANIFRYVFPMLVAFWAIMGAVVAQAQKEWGDWRVRLLVLWIVPGSVFFMLGHMADPTYLNYLVAAVLLLGLSAPRKMAVAAVWNAAVFLLFFPINSSKLVFQAVNVYAGKYTRYGVRHQWQPNLSDLQRTAGPTN